MLARDGIDGARERILAALRGEQAMLDLRVAYRRERSTSQPGICGESHPRADDGRVDGSGDAACRAATSSPSGKSVRQPNKVDLAIIAMGKCGRELNYISDVDVVFIAEPSST